MAARRVGVSASTSFRWRHRLCEGLREMHGDELEGTVELGVIRFPESSKGRRAGDRPPRRRGLPPDFRFRDRRLVPVALFCDRRGGAMASLIHDRDVFRLRLEAAITRRLRGRPRLVVAQGAAGPFSNASLRSGHPSFSRIHIHSGPALTLLWLRPSVLSQFDRLIDPEAHGALAARSGMLHMRTVCRYAARLIAWIARFNGVATRYLINYLAWHLAVDRAEWRLALAKIALRWPLGP